MMTPQTSEDTGIQTIIIYKSYTPQRKAYAQTYYQKNRERLKSKQKEYYENNKDEIKQCNDLKEKNKIAHNKYMDKLRENPERLEKYKQKRREYYANKKLKSASNINSNCDD
jgi:hypothetical protein